MKASRRLDAKLQKEALRRIAESMRASGAEIACPACESAGLSVVDQSARPFVEWYKLTCKACGLSENLQLVMPAPARILDL
jgi:transcription elongation factor Elf1